jgi:hypothetical protein
MRESREEERSGHPDAVLVKGSESRVRSLVLKIFVPPVLVPPAIAFGGVSPPPRPPGAHVRAHSRKKVKLFVDNPSLEISLAHLYGKVAVGVVGLVGGWIDAWIHVIDAWIHVRIDARASVWPGNPHTCM